MEGLATEGIKLLYQLGGAGWVLAGLEALVIYYLYQEGKRCSQAHIEDGKEGVRYISENTKTVEGLALSLESRTRAAEAVVVSLDRLAEKIDSHDKRVAERVEDIRRQMGR